MRKFVCEVVAKQSMGADEIKQAEIWGEDEADFIDEGIFELISEMGYELVPGGEIMGTDEYEDLDPDYIEDRIAIL